MFQKLLANKHYSSRDLKSRPRTGRKRKKTRRFIKSCNRALKLTCFILSAMRGTGGLSSRCDKLFCERSAPEPWHSYRRHLLLHNDRISLRETWLSLPFTIRVFPLQVLTSSCLLQQILNTSPHSLRWAQEFTWIALSHKEYSQMFK